MVSESPLLTFPTDYPIKVVGRTGGTLRTRADAIITRHVPDLDRQLTTERLSENGNFVSISYSIRATSREQVVALATELSACPEVMMVL
ncbi:MAG: YbeD family protein [Gammaproteobacteria bacterium]